MIVFFFKHCYFRIISVNFVISFSCLQASTLGLVFFVSYCFVEIEKQKKLQQHCKFVINTVGGGGVIDFLCRQK